MAIFIDFYLNPICYQLFRLYFFGGEFNFKEKFKFILFLIPDFLLFFLIIFLPFIFHFHFPYPIFLSNLAPLLRFLYNP